MKIDYDFLKQILIVMVDNDSYEIDTEKLMEKLEIDEDNKQKIDSFLGHLCILNDNNCLDCRDDDLGIISRGSDGGMLLHCGIFSPNCTRISISRCSEK